MFAETNPFGRKTLHRVSLQPSQGVLAILPQDCVLTPERAIASQKGVR